VSNQRLLLIGGGHAHVAVLADWIRNGLPARATLITPSPTMRYSGMVPGWIAGEYQRDDGLVDLVGLTEHAGVELLLDRCVGLDLESNLAAVSSGRSVSFDVASIDTGGVGRAHSLLGDDPRLLDVRPIDGFVESLAKLSDSKIHQIAVIGGGAGGVELAFALRNARRLAKRPQVVLATGKEGLLPKFSNASRRRVMDELGQQDIKVLEIDARIADGKLLGAQRSLEPVDLIVAAMGSAAPEWPKASGLGCDEHGFIAVDRFQRSVSHPHIFAVGDVAARQDRNVPHSGVHAVHAGPIMATNLRSVIDGNGPTRSYQPRPASLYLLSTGNGSAIGSYGPLTAQGRWVGRFKRWIDKRWIGSYARLASGG